MPKASINSTNQSDQHHLQKIIDELTSIRQNMLNLVQSSNSHMTSLHPGWAESAENLLHYLALRQKDIRDLQEKLANLGVSSLGRTESHVLASLNALLRTLCSMNNQKLELESPHCLSFSEGRHKLEHHTEMLLGSRPKQRDTRIMVTMPSEAATDYLLIRELVSSGMDCMRINCAHDNEESWGLMIENLRRAKRELGKKCRILMDLGGPKLRTGPLENGPAIIKWRPRRDELGRVLEPARIWIRPDNLNEEPDIAADAILPLPKKWVTSLCSGDIITFKDTRKASRTIRIVSAAGDCRWGESHNTAYVAPGTTMTRSIPSKKDANGKTQGKARVCAFVGEPTPLHLHIGDVLLITKSMEPGRNAVYDEQGKLLSHPFIGCSLPEVFGCVKPGERIIFDDGKIPGIIKAVYPDRLKVQIVNARPQGEKLGPEKGINLPDSRLNLSAFTEKDQKDLQFIVRHSHMVGMSFAQEVADVKALSEALATLNGQHVGILLKIETRRGFEMLPDLILAAMHNQSAGIMIARGDLAVECGYERLAEIQEEILWLCEAAHMPVIWATQVLESLAKTGIPSRAEITDAAMSGRAECVMLNKGPHIVDAVNVLDNILQRMAAHQTKKSSLLRQLRWWEQAMSNCS